MKNQITFSLIILLLAQSSAIAQHGHSQEQKPDPRYSVFGPPIPAIWKFQLSHLQKDGENVSALNLYRKDQRDKTLFFTILNNGLDNTNQYRVQQISGGVILYPFKDDDRYQLDVGGTLDKTIDTTLYNSTIFSRFTWRPSRAQWIRLGAEYFDGYEPGHSTQLFNESSLNSFYLATKYKTGFFSTFAVVGRGTINTNLNDRFGVGGLIDGQFNTFLFGGYIKSTDEKEDVRTLAIGRWSSFRPDGLPSGVFIWKHRSDYDFQLGGIFFGGRNQFVAPAAIGMITGMFVSSTTLRVNSQLRQRKLMTITDDYTNSDFAAYYVHLNQKIDENAHVGFTVVQFFMYFTDTKYSIFSEPVIGIHYNEETKPEFDMATFSLVDKTENFWSYQLGVIIADKFMLDAIHFPTRSGFTLAVSYLLK
ncbi:MAG: hypothetical protein HQ509_03040 [Candidatus Marinimicrobia bacterium]|nr:hypothetical protein [Candidatus Neomarinimicrobiota bacterium]